MSGDLVPTRLALHAVAEHVLAPFRYGNTGHIGLAVVGGGVGTPWVPTSEGDLRAALEGVELVVSDGDGERTRAPLTTVADAASVLGIEPGGVADVYTPATPFEPDAPLSLDARAAAELDEWFVLGDRVLLGLAADDDVDPPTLWPEHFDLALTIDEVNYGFSPGDDTSEEPYAYVGPWSPPAQGGFWNARFGALRTRRDLGSAEAALAFFEEGRRRAAEAASP